MNPDFEKENRKMLTTTIGLSALTFAATVLHLRSQREIKSIAMMEMWKIRGYQEDDARRSRKSDF